jgi:predicted PurR-regulated permease PerM
MRFLATLRANIAAALLGLLAAILLAISVYQTIRIEGFGIWPLKIPGLQDKYNAALQKLTEARFELDRISSRKNEQKRETVNRISESQKHIQNRDGVAREIEAAPLPGGCRTPEAVRQIA